MFMAAGSYVYLPVHQSYWSGTDSRTVKQHVFQQYLYIKVKFLNKTLNKTTSITLVQKNICVKNSPHANIPAGKAELVRNYFSWRNNFVSVAPFSLLFCLSHNYLETILVCSDAAP